MIRHIDAQHPLVFIIQYSRLLLYCKKNKENKVLNGIFLLSAGHSTDDLPRSGGSAASWPGVGGNSDQFGQVLQEFQRTQGHGHDQQSVQ